MAEFLLALFLFALIYGGLLCIDSKKFITYYHHCHILIISGKGEGQIRVVDNYDPEAKTLTLSRPWNIEPDHTSEFIMINHNGQVINHG